MKNKNATIAQIENNLLPPVLIEGELPYNLQSRMAYYDVPGISVAVIENFKVDWVKHYGLRDAELGQPVTDSTVFCAGSLSKAAAAATILHLIDQGMFTLDDNVNDHLKSWKVPENEFTRKSKVTIGRLMNHSGGLMFRQGYTYAPDKLPRLIDYLNAKPPLDIQPVCIGYEPGTAFVYSNDGYSALQILAEDVTGKAYVDFARDVLLDPLNMKYSTFEQPLSREKERSAAVGHKHDGTVQENKRFAYPPLTAGGLWSTAEEYARFVIEIQRALRGESNLIMSQELARQMTSPHEAKEYGFGVFLRRTDEVDYFSHMGDLEGFFAGFTAHPADGYGAVVMTNGMNGIGLIREIISGIAQVYDWQTFLPKPYARYKLEPEIMAEYVGRYQLDFENICSVYEKDGELFYTTPDMEDFQLYPISSDTLVSKRRLGQIVFIADSNGMVSKCIPHFSDSVGRLPPKKTEATKLAGS